MAGAGRARQAPRHRAVGHQDRRHVVGPDNDRGRASTRHPRSARRRPACAWWPTDRCCTRLPIPGRREVVRTFDVPGVEPPFRDVRVHPARTSPDLRLPADAEPRPAPVPAGTEAAGAPHAWQRRALAVDVVDGDDRRREVDPRADGRHGPAGGRVPARLNAVAAAPPGRPSGPPAGSTGPGSRRDRPRWRAPFRTQLRRCRRASSGRPPEGRPRNRTHRDLPPVPSR